MRSMHFADQPGPEELSKLEALLFDGNRAVSNAAVAAPSDGNRDEPLEQCSPFQATADALAIPQKDSCSLESMQDGACRNPLFEEPKAGNGEQASGLTPTQKAGNVHMLEADMSARERDAFERGDTPPPLLSPQTGDSSPPFFLSTKITQASSCCAIYICNLMTAAAIRPSQLSKPQQAARIR